MKAKKLVTNALIAALYAGCTLALAPISYGVMQFRVSEALTLLPFIRKDTIWGITIGCLRANLLNPMGVNPLDVVFGTIATLLAALVTARCKKVWLAAIPPVVSNGIIIGAMLAFTLTPDAFMASFAAFGLQIALEEAVVCFLLGIPLESLVRKLGILKKK